MRLWLLNRFTNYHSRYGYPMWEAFVAEIWWRVEHSRFDHMLHAYGRRKAWEHRGYERRWKDPDPVNVAQVLADVPQAAREEFMGMFRRPADDETHG